jgi:hypothetical protein
MEARPTMIADLYQEEIYQIKDRVLIVLAVSWDSLSQDDKVLLSKILGAIRLSLDGVQIISQQSLDFQYISNLAPKWVIQFSNEATDDIPYYVATTIEGVSLIKSHTLGDLDDARKKSLWMALKGLIQA